MHTHKYRHMHMITCVYAHTFMCKATHKTHVSTIHICTPTHVHVHTQAPREFNRKDNV